MVHEPTQPMQRFATLLRTEWAKLDVKHQTGLDTEDLLDSFWLATYLQSGTQTTSATQTPETSVTTRQSHEVVAPPPQNRAPKVSVSLPPPPVDTPAGSQAGLGAGLPLQVPAASALRSPLDLARALRPLMRRIPSPTQYRLNEEATVVQIAEQGVWSPVLERAPERWFDLAIVVEAGPALKLWEETIAELKTLVEQQGAFRQIRTWSLQGKPGAAIQVSRNWQPTSKTRPLSRASALLDPTRRQIIWLVSDCISDLWDDPAIYEWLAKWGKHSPLAIVQLLPERLWARTALGVGLPMLLHAAAPGATQAVLSAGATPLDAVVSADVGTSDQQSVTLPVISLEPEPLHRWANVTTGVGDASLAGLKIDLSQLTPPLGTPAQASPLPPEQRVQQLQQFWVTASITAQKLAGLMAAVPVSVPVAHLIQKTLLPQSRQVHLAEVFMSGLLDEIPSPPSSPHQSTQYRFPEPVREKLLDAVPISKTTQVLDTISAYISERLGLGTKSFAALIRLAPTLEPYQQQALHPFAELAFSTLRRLGGDHRAQAEALAPFLNPMPPEPTLLRLPPLQEHRYQVATVEVEPLQRFDFETATIKQQRRRGGQKQPKWVITKAPGYGWQRVEELGGGIQLELVEILEGRFQMGSPEDEPERYNDESPQHEVGLNDFFIGKYPITQAQWQAVAALPQINQALDPDPSYFKGEKRPVEQVSWHDAVEFCARLSAFTSREYGLPTEAEWEYACRAGTTTPFHFGDTITTDLANYRGTDLKQEDRTYSGSYGQGPKGIYREETTAVGSFPANAWGLYDLHGNVWEWCADDWHENYAEKPEALKANGHLPWTLTEALPAAGARRSLRGGSWNNDPGICRSAFRDNDEPDERYVSLGFRVVCRAARTPK